MVSQMQDVIVILEVLYAIEYASGKVGVCVS